jgi:hypothetical protein
VTEALIGDTAVSDEVLQLVKTVERLGAADQERILRIVKLLAVVPGRIQSNTQQMLRSLINGSPNSIYDNVDQVIEYLEDSLLSEISRAGAEDDAFTFPWRSGLSN